MAPRAVTERVLAPEIEAQLKNHAGEYVAVAGDRLVAWGANPAAVLAEARSKSSEIPLLFRVPADENRAYFF